MLSSEEAFELAQSHPKCAINMIRLKRHGKLAKTHIRNLTFFKWKGKPISANTANLVIPLQQFFLSTNIDADLWERKLLAPIKALEHELAQRKNLSIPKNFTPHLATAQELLNETCGKIDNSTTNLATILQDATPKTCGKTIDDEHLATSKPMGSLTIQWKTCGKINCRCQNGQKHGPYAYFRKYNASKPSKQDWHYLGKASTANFRESCLKFSLDPKNIEEEIENLVLES